MRKLILATAAAIVSFAAVPAMAQEDGGAAPFTGIHAEGTVGLERLGTGNDHDRGLEYGFGAGYDAAVGHGLILGAEGEIAESKAKACGSVASAVDQLCTRTGRDLYVGARAGVPVTPSLLLYGKAGYTNARFSSRYDDGGTGAQNFHVSRNKDGYRLGAGAEFAVTQNAFVKAEYRYSNYSNGLDKNQVVAGAGVRF